MPQPDTKDRILDAAEGLFAEHGVDATSLRAITAEAGVNLAAVNYHFGSKESLIEQVYARRIGPLNRERLERLEALERSARADGSPGLEEVLTAFLEPALRMRESEGAEKCVQLLGRTFAGPHGTAREILLAQFREVAHRFHAAFARTLPHLDGDEVFWRMFFLIGAMAHTMSAADLLTAVAGKRCGADDAATQLRRLVSFAAAGMRAPAVAPEAVS